MKASEEHVSDAVLTVPNVISLARLSLVPVFAWVFLTRSNDTVAFALLVVIGATDWVDGFVARLTGQVSRLGKLIDPVADRIAIVVVLAAMTFRGTLDFRVTAIIVLRDLLVAIAFPIVEARGVPRIPVNWTGKAATAAIYTGVGFAGLTLIAPMGWVRVTSLFLLWAGAAAYWAAGFMYAIEARRRLKSR